MNIDVIYSEGVLHLRPLADEVPVYIEENANSCETSYFTEGD